VPEHGPPSTVPGATSATTAAHNEPIHEADVPGSDPHSPWQDREDSPLPEPHQTDVDALDELHDSASMSESADEDDLDLDTPSEVDLSHGKLNAWLAQLILLTVLCRPPFVGTRR